MWLFAESRIEVAVLEVGLGGRLDAVNAFDADCAVVAARRSRPRGLSWAATARRSVSRRRAFSAAAGPAICADPAPPASLVAHAAEIGAQLLLIGADFGVTPQDRQWQYWGPRGKRSALPHPALRGGYPARQCSGGNHRARMPARAAAGDHERYPRRPAAGGPSGPFPGPAGPAGGHPRRRAQSRRRRGRWRPVSRPWAAAGARSPCSSMLKDKDIAGVVAALKSSVAHWFIAGLGGPRGAGVAELRRALAAAAVDCRSRRVRDVAAAYTQACDMAAENDRIMVFGSFYTVAAVMQLRSVAGARG